jgi:hypothetical protein
MTTLFGNGQRILIINEAHKLTARQVTFCLTFLESLGNSLTVLFTSTNEGQSDFFDGQLDASPFLSRCVEIRLTIKGLNPIFAARALEIARAEGLDGRELPAYVALVKRHNNNMRRVLCDIEKGVMLAGPGSEETAA